MRFGFVGNITLITALFLVAASAAGREVDAELRHELPDSLDPQSRKKLEGILNDLRNPIEPKTPIVSLRRKQGYIPSTLAIDPSKLIPQSEGEEDAVASFFRRKDYNKRPASPSDDAIAFRNRASYLDSQCKLAKKFCSETQAYTRIAERLSEAGRLHADCDVAANAYKQEYLDREPVGAVAINYDAACLGSLVNRSSNGHLVASEPLPQIFVGTATARGVLATVGIIEYANKAFCAGLIRRDLSLITARHCYQSDKVEFATGKVRVRAADNSGSWGVVAAPVRESVGPESVDNDWIVLRLTGADPVLAEDVSLARLSEPESVTLIGPFHQFSLMTYPDVAKEEQRRLRFPRDNMCHAIRSDNGCLVTSCQTVPGFSGTPIFRQQRSALGKLVVVGFVSGSISSSSCVSEGNSPTYAVSAEVVAPIQTANRTNGEPAL